MFAKCLLTIDAGRWKAVIGPKETLLGPTTIPLVNIAEAIEKIYPTVLVYIDPKISPNVWFKKHIKLQTTYGLNPFFEDISAEFENNEPKICSRCRHDAYYNSSAKAWQCPYCLARESHIDKGRFFTVRRRNEKGRMKEYFNE
jgi:ribosomal protein L37AE/L43A